jgi:AraC family transcriptional regulator
LERVTGERPERRIGVLPSRGDDAGSVYLYGCGVRLEGIYGIPLDDSASVPLDRLRYDACLALGATTAPQPLRVLALPAGDYARLRHLGSYDGLEATTQNLVGDWLPASGWEPANFPVFHHFISDPDATPVEELVTNILLPLASSQGPARD